MKTPLVYCAGALLLGALLFSGCESTGDGGGSTAVYYGTGFYDPWYYGEVHYDGDITVTPPDLDRPRPEHPIARPPSSSIGARPTPMPSVPSMPRAMPRGGGGRR